MKVLIVDDNPDDRTAIRSFLSRACVAEGLDFSFCEANTGERGLAAYRSEAPDCVLLDYFLPDMNGLEFLASVEAEFGVVTLPVVLLTGFADRSVGRAALRAGAQEYLPKQFLGPEMLLRAVESAKDRFDLCADRRRAEASLFSSELMQARQRLAHQVGGIAFTNHLLSEGAAVVSDEFALLYGLPQGRRSLSRQEWLALVHPEDRDLLAAETLAIHTSGGTLATDFRIILSDGTVRWISMRTHAFPGPDGRPFRVITAQQDTTEIVTARKALAESNQNLEKRVSEEVAAREEAQTRAAHAQRLQALGQLAGGIAHDFNNVLQAVQAGIALIDRRATDPVSVRRLADTIMKASDSGAAVTSRLLAFARRDDLRAERLDLAGLLEGLRELLGRTLGSPISVRVACDAGLPAVMTDRGQLETVVVNLATNARDAMPTGGTLTFAANLDVMTAGQANPFDLKPGTYVRLTFTDTGTGMDRATLDRAFEPFFTTKSRDRGTGLGLSMAKGFAEQSGGNLVLDSKPGQGTAVRLWLPAASGSVSTPQMEPGHLVFATRRRRLLVVDDQEVVRETVAATLEDAGFSVLTAENGIEALALLASGEAVDVLVSDFSMPGMDGLTLIREAQIQRPGLPAVLLTGYAGDSEDLKADHDSNGPLAIVQKPATVGQIVGGIEALIAKHQEPAD